MKVTSTALTGRKHMRKFYVISDFTECVFVRANTVKHLHDKIFKLTRILSEENVKLFGYIVDSILL